VPLTKCSLLAWGLGEDRVELGLVDLTILVEVCALHPRVNVFGALDPQPSGDLRALLRQDLLQLTLREKTIVIMIAQREELLDGFIQRRLGWHR